MFVCLFVCLFVWLYCTSGHFSGINSSKSSRTSPWITISSGPVNDEPHEYFCANNLAAFFKSISERDTIMSPGHQLVSYAHTCTCIHWTLDLVLVVSNMTELTLEIGLFGPTKQQTSERQTAAQSTTDRKAGRQKRRQIGCQKNSQAGRQTDRQSYTDRQTERQTDG